MTKSTSVSSLGQVKIETEQVEKQKVVQNKPLFGGFSNRHTPTTLPMLQGIQIFPLFHVRPLCVCLERFSCLIVRKMHVTERCRLALDIVSLCFISQIFYVYKIYKYYFLI